MVILALFLLDKTGVIKGGYGSFSCQVPTKENPLGNVMLTDYVDDPDRPPACYYPTVEREVKENLDNTVEFYVNRSRGPAPSVQRRAFARQFISAPVTSIPGDQTAFAEWLYGKKFSPLCRDDPSQCDPNYWGAQTEAYSGFDPANNPRGGRGGHGR